MGVDFRQRREQRRQFIIALYEKVDASVSTFVSAFEIGGALGIDDDECKRMFEYFEEKGYLLVDDHRTGIVRITAGGIDHVEALAD